MCEEEEESNGAEQARGGLPLIELGRMHQAVDEAVGCMRGAAWILYGLEMADDGTSTGLAQAYELMATMLYERSADLESMAREARRAERQKA